MLFLFPPWVLLVALVDKEEPVCDAADDLPPTDLDFYDVFVKKINIELDP